MTNGDKCPSLLSPTLMLISLLHFADQQGIGSGRFSGGQRSISPGAVALSALHCVWDHNVHLRHRCIDFLPVRKATLKAALVQGYTQKGQTPHMNINSCITCTCKIISSLCSINPVRTHAVQWLHQDGKERMDKERTVETQQESWCTDCNRF